MCEVPKLEGNTTDEKTEEPEGQEAKMRVGGPRVSRAGSNLMKVMIQVPSDWAAGTVRLTEATEDALRRYRRGLGGIGPDMRLVRIRCDLVNYGLVDDPDAMRVFAVDIDNGLATWLDNLAAFVNRDIVHRSATVKGIVRVALRLNGVHEPELGGSLRFARVP